MECVFYFGIVTAGCVKLLAYGHDHGVTSFICIIFNFQLVGAGL